MVRTSCAYLTKNGNVSVNETITTQRIQSMIKYNEIIRHLINFNVLTLKCYKIKTIRDFLTIKN